LEPLKKPLGCLFIGKRPPLKLNLEAMSSPRRASPLALKLFGGPGEPNAGLCELGPRKNKEKTLLPSELG